MDTTRGERKTHLGYRGVHIRITDQEWFDLRDDLTRQHLSLANFLGDFIRRYLQIKNANKQVNPIEERIDNEQDSRGQTQLRP